MSHLIFTSNYHTIVRGVLKPGFPCLFNYDPSRLIGPPEYTFGDPAYSFTGHLTFLPSGANETVSLVSQVGLLKEPIRRSDGSGSMLRGEFTIPTGTLEIISWITLVNPSGTVAYDSCFGENYHFRMAGEDISAHQATLSIEGKSALATFRISLTARPDVAHISVKYRQINAAELDRGTELILTKNKGNEIWSGQVNVPKDAVLAYEVRYQIEGKSYTLDNNGNYFVVLP